MKKPRRIDASRAGQPPQVACPKCGEDTIRAIRADATLGQRKIGRKYNISKSTAWTIVNRKACRHVA